MANWPFADELFCVALPACTHMPVTISSTTIRVALVEDDVYFQQALRDTIEGAPDMRLVSVSCTLAAGLRAVAGEPVDVLLVDLGLPDGSGIEIIRAAHARWPLCGIMVCTAFGDELHVMQSLEAGAAGYLLKDSAAPSMLAEIRSLHAGGSPISPMIARQILMRFHAQDKPAVARRPIVAEKPRATLSGREQQVLEFITKGFSFDEIAGLLSVSRHTVQTYVRRI